MRIVKSNDKMNLKLLHTGYKVGEKVKQYDECWSHSLNELILVRGGLLPEV